MHGSTSSLGVEGERLHQLDSPSKPGFTHGVLLLAGPLGQSWLEFAVCDPRSYLGLV